MVNLALLLVYFNYSIFDKEKTIADGKLVLLKLAPVDPRSLMQGDYMRLRYEIAEIQDQQLIPKRGYCVVNLDNSGIAHKVRLQKNKTPLTNIERLVKYSQTDRDISIGAESYFFEEGQSEKYATAVYGALRIDNDGNSVLIGLYNKDFKLIK